MKKEIMKDPFFLSQKAIPANPITDKQVIIDLQDTLRSNRDRCVGLAANMIGSHKAIIIVAAGPFDIVMVNPVITKKSQPYQTEEGCLSHTGMKSTTRYQDATGKNHTGIFSEFTAQVIQHEIDHLQGILI